MSLLGPVGTLFGLGSGIFNLINNHNNAAATVDFRNSVTAQLTQISTALKGIKKELDYEAALQKWDTDYSDFVKACNDIVGIWDAIGMSDYMSGGTLDESWFSAKSETASNLNSIPTAYMGQIEGAIAGNLFSTPTGVVRAYIDLFHDKLAADSTSVQAMSICDMAYVYWHHIVLVEFQAYLMWSLACKINPNTYSASTMANWSPTVDNQSVPYQQGATVQGQIYAALQDYGYEAFCSIRPLQSLTNPCQSVVQSAFHEPIWRGGMAQGAQGPAGKVLFSWRFHGDWSQTDLRYGPMTPRLYYGTPDAVTGLIDPSTIEEVEFDYKQGPDDTYIDTTALQIYNNNNSSDLCYTSGPVIGAWWTANIAEQPTQNAAGDPTTYATNGLSGPGIPSQMPQQALLTNLSITKRFAATGVSDGGPVAIYFLKTYIQYCPPSAPDGYNVTFSPLNTEDLTSVNYAPSNLPAPLTNDLIQSQFVTFACVGADTTKTVNGQQVPVDLTRDPMTFSQPMMPMTGVGLSYYQDGDYVVIVPRNFYGYHLHMFGG